jgi:hypothetical protein
VVAGSAEKNNQYTLQRFVYSRNKKVVPILRGVIPSRCGMRTKARDQPCPQAKNVLLLRLLDLCVLPSGTGLVGGHSAQVNLNRRDLFFSLSGLGEHALARITSVVVS